MPKSARPRKKYRPQPFRLPATIRYSQADEQHLQLVPHVSLEQRRTGDADEGAWHTLAVRVNWGVVLAARHDHLAECRPVMAASIGALRSIWERHGRTGAWGFSGEEYRALGDALVLVDEMQLALPRRDLLDALRVTFKVAGREELAGELQEVDA
jgi:hypothetical protein